MATKTLHELEFGERRLVVDSESGARVARFEFRGQNILTDSSYHEIYWGSTLWSAPESDWQHPAPRNLDRGPFRLTNQRDNSLTFESVEHARFSQKTIRARKTFLAEKSGSLRVTYEFENAGNDAFKVAPWEVTRVPGGGLSFFPHKATVKTTPGMNRRLQDGIAWFDHAAMGPGGQKIWAHGSEGWLAHAADGLLHVKEFDNLAVQDLAPGEGDVEVYSSGNPQEGKTYVELEALGPYVLLKPGQLTSWGVRWHLEPVFPSSTLEPACPELLRQARLFRKTANR